MLDPESPEKSIEDYKFFCFDGVVRAMFIATERQKAGEEVKFDFYDADGKHLDLRQGHPNAEITPEIPETFAKMKALAEKLSEGIPHVRIDFYEVNGKVYFGEITFYPSGGFDPKRLPEADLLFGSMINLDKVK